MFYQGAISLIFKGFPILQWIFINFNRFLQTSIDFVCFCLMIFIYFFNFYVQNLSDNHWKTFRKPFQNLSKINLKIIEKSLKNLSKNLSKTSPKTSPKPLQKPLQKPIQNLSKNLYFSDLPKSEFCVYIYIAFWSNLV